VGRTWPRDRGGDAACRGHDVGPEEALASPPEDRAVARATARSHWDQPFEYSLPRKKSGVPTEISSGSPPMLVREDEHALA
jgi:hypothetical protein